MAAGYHRAAWWQLAGRFKDGARNRMVGAVGANGARWECGGDFDGWVTDHKRDTKKGTRCRRLKAFQSWRVWMTCANVGGRPTDTGLAEAVFEGGEGVWESSDDHGI